MAYSEGTEPRGLVLYPLGGNMAELYCTVDVMTAESADELRDALVRHERAVLGR